MAFGLYMVLRPPPLFLGPLFSLTVGDAGGGAGGGVGAAGGEADDAFVLPPLFFLPCLAISFLLGYLVVE